MALRLSKRTALQLFCCFRQAERSAHYALSCPSQWTQFVAYYDETKQARIAELIALLHDAGAARENAPIRQALAQSDFVGMVSGAVGLLLNPLKKSWSFSAREISFFFVTLEHILKILHTAGPLQKEKLIDFRMDCFDCHSIIAHKLIGVPEIRQAQSIEHWLQSEKINHVTLKDLGIDGQVVHQTGRGWNSPRGSI